MAKEQKMIGYVRVSTIEQDVDLQVGVLLQAGCDKKISLLKKASGFKKTVHNYLIPFLRVAYSDASRSPIPIDVDH